MNIGKQFKEGMITNNPVLVQLLGMCSTMAITTSFFNGLGMGVAVIIILTLSNVLISAMRKIIPDKIRIAMFIVVIAGFVTCVDLLLQAFVPALSESLGVFIPLIVVNCIILGRAEAFSYKNGIAASFFDGIFQGVGYTVVLVIMCVIRELLGSGTFGGGLLNGGGRIVWSTISDYIGRANTYLAFFVIEIVAFYLLGGVNESFMFQLLVFIIITCYGGGFSCMPAYLSDLFGTKQLSAIHGRILTAWGLAGIAGPLLLSVIYERTHSYSFTLYFFSACFVVSLLLAAVLKLKGKTA